MFKFERISLICDYLLLYVRKLIFVKCLKDDFIIVSFIKRLVAVSGIISQTIVLYTQTQNVTKWKN